MDKIIGTNLGNWLVLEKWMQPFIFKGTGAEDETCLSVYEPVFSDISRAFGMSDQLCN